MIGLIELEEMFIKEYNKIREKIGNEILLDNEIIQIQRDFAGLRNNFDHSEESTKKLSELIEHLQKRGEILEIAENLDLDNIAENLDLDNIAETVEFQDINNGNKEDVGPEVTEPEVTEPEVVEPRVVGPEVTESEVVESEVTEPEAVKSGNNLSGWKMKSVEEMEVKAGLRSKNDPEYLAVKARQQAEKEKAKKDLSGWQMKPVEKMEVEAGLRSENDPDYLKAMEKESEINIAENVENQNINDVNKEAVGPEVVGPEVVEPRVVESEVVESEVTEPEVTEPEAVKPGNNLSGWKMKSVEEMEVEAGLRSKNDPDYLAVKARQQAENEKAKKDLSGWQMKPVEKMEVEAGLRSENDSDYLKVMGKESEIKKDTKTWLNRFSKFYRFSKSKDNVREAHKVLKEIVGIVNGKNQDIDMIPGIS